VDLRELIIATYGADAAEAWAKCSLGDADREKLVEAGRRTLDLFAGRMRIRFDERHVFCRARKARGAAARERDSGAYLMLKMSTFVRGMSRS